MTIYPQRLINRARYGHISRLLSAVYYDWLQQFFVSLVVVPVLKRSITNI
jgi:hypothetical protein